MLDDQKEARPSYQPKARNMHNMPKCITSRASEANHQAVKEFAFVVATVIAFFTIPAILSVTKLAGWW